MNLYIFSSVLLVVFVACNVTTQEAGNTCYPNVGCFSSLSPWTSIKRRVPSPQHPQNVSTYMYYYNRDLSNGTIFTIFPEINLTAIPHDANKKAYMIFHGLTGNGTYPWIVELKDVLLEKEDADIFVVEYNQGARGSYEQAISNGKKPARLTALDPAGPLFERENPMIRLTPQDADLVDVWHTDIKYPGMKSPCGHIDFYFNGGKRQPGCDFSDKANEMMTCSHVIAHDFYVEAVKDDCMIGQPANLLLDALGVPYDVKVKPTKGCKDSNVCSPTGLGVTESDARGIFSVSTNNNSPYCIPI